MPQIQLPIYPEGVTHITSELAFKSEDSRVTYFNGTMPLFIHDESDVSTFRMITSQFCVNGHAKQSEIARAFGIPLISVKRAVKVYREQGVKGFYAPRKGRGPAVLTSLMLQKVQGMLDKGALVADVADELGLKSNTLAKAVRAGRLHVPTKKKIQIQTASQ